jgi:hypothetical protein
MQVFTYPLFYKILLRYGNIPVTLLLSVYLVPIVVELDKKLILLIPLIIILLLIYLLNKHYIYLYKVLPCKIEADSEKLICSDFFLSKKKIIIFYKDIISLSGGIFEGRLRGLMRLLDGKNKLTIGFYSSIKNNKVLEKLILCSIPQKTYEDIIEKTGKRK